MQRRVLALIFLVAMPAIAGDPTAADLKKQGDEAMHAMHYREALDFYERASKLSPDPALLYNRGRALEALGEYPAALDVLEEFVRIAPDDLKVRVPKLAELVADVRSRVALIVVSSNVSGSRVIVRRKVEGTTPLPAPLRLAAGDAEVEVDAEGYKPFHQNVTLTGGKMVSIDAQLVREGEPKPLEPPPVEPEPPPKGNGMRIVAITTGVVAVGGLAVGGIFAGLVASKKSAADPHCPNKMCDMVGSAAIADAKTFATVSTIGFIAGGVLAAGAVGMFILSPKAKPKTAWSPIVGPGFVGAEGTF